MERAHDTFVVQYGLAMEGKMRMAEVITLKRQFMF